MNNLNAARSSQTIYRELTRNSTATLDTTSPWDNVSAHRMLRDLVNAGVRPEAEYTGASAASIR